MNSGWNDRFVQAAKRQGRWSFRKLPRAQREELTNDVVSVAWEVFMAAPERACPTSAAWIAVRRVKGRRQFDESHSSLTGPPRRGYYRPCRSDFKLSDFIRFGEDPAVIVAFKDLYAIWFGQLNKRQQQIVTLLWAGYRTDETAAIVGVTPGRVSQIRREVETIWDIVNL